MYSDFITVKEAIELIKSDTRKNPVVDIETMIENYNFIELFHNFRIPLLTLDKNGNVVENGNRYVTFEKELEMLMFKDTILEHFRKLTSANYDEEAITNPTKSITTVHDPEKNPASKPQVNPDGAKVGDDGIK